MTKITTINSPVCVTAFAFGRDLRAYPRRIEYMGTTHHFIDAGLRTIVRRGERIAHILTMTDGRGEYCLRSDDHGSWVLLSISL